jgi:hypothetical protein
MLSFALINHSYVQDVGRVRQRRRKGGIGTITFGEASLSESSYGETGLELMGSVPSNAIPIFSDTKDLDGAMAAFASAPALN